MTTDLPAFVAHLRSLGVELSAHEGRLAVRAPRGALDVETREELARRKVELLAWLATPATPTEALTLRALAGRRVAITGATGFLGKVFVARLLTLAPDVGRIELLLRGRGRHRTAQARMEAQILASPVFAGLTPGERVHAVDAALGEARFGLAEAGHAALAGRIDLVVHIAGLVELSPPLGAALEANVEGARHAIALAEAAGAPLLHVSTCYVSGCTPGPIPEAVVPGRAPRDGAPFDVEAELRACRAAMSRSQDRAADPALRAELHAEGRAEADLVGAARERARAELAEWSARRVASWGFANVYTYTKALAEQLVTHAVAAGRVRAAIVRPAILESTAAVPLPGWNQGINTSAPLVHLVKNGQHAIPAAEGRHLDVLPVDMAADAMVAVAAALVAGRAEPVYQLASGDTNPVSIARLVELTALHYRHEGGLDRLVSEPRATRPQTYARTSAPMLATLAERASALAREARRHTPERGLGRDVRGWLARADRSFEAARSDLRRVDELFDEYRVVLDGADATYRTDRTRALIAAFPPEDRAALSYAPERIDWRAYWMDVHLPALERWTLAELPDERPVRPLTDRLVGAPLDPGPAGLVARLLAAPGEDDALVLGGFSRAELHARIAGCTARLRIEGVADGVRVGLLSENSPAWVIAWFGVLAAGGTVVPLDPTLEDAERTHLVERARCRLVLASPKERRPGMADLSAFAAETGDPATLRAGPASDRAVTLLYTSGTEGRRKGVLLGERGLCAQVAALATLYPLTPDELVLGVLPLHHAFQLTCGLLHPLLAGARVCFLDEATPKGLARALSRHRPTAMIAVPAVLDAIWRTARTRMDESPAAPAVDALLWLGGVARDLAEEPLGARIFAAAHDALGGRLRTVVSGGAPLAAATFEGLRGLGLDVYEGYGLSEASPVVCAWPRGSRPLAGQVGPPIPGVEVRLDRATDGVGEVVVRTPGRMLGYDDDPERTAAALTPDGWLRTGDLGVLEDGALRIVGRSKDEIVDATGHTLHPDELERDLRGVDGVEELSVVGMTHGGGEVAAALVRLADGADRAAVERALRARSADAPAWRRVRTYTFTTEPLPRGPTGKVRRPEVRARLAAAGDGDDPEQRRARAMVAEVLHVPVESLRAGATLDELGLDSLARAELGARLGATDDLHRLDDVARRLGAPAPPPSETETPVLPEPLRVLGQRVAEGARRMAYERLLDVEVEGDEHIPWNQNAIIVANHCSHLDVGLIRQALGSYAADARSIAAQDYFFDSPAARFVFTNFSSLLPLDRGAPTRGQLDPLVEALRAGDSLIFFPEGTRSVDGRMAAFKAGVGFLALHAEVGVLPLYLEGTHEALPKGAAVPRSRYLRVRIGAFLAPEALAAATTGMPRRRAYDKVAALAEAAVVRLKEGRHG